jgi:hypothetical protein
MDNSQWRQSMPLTVIFLLGFVAAVIVGVVAWAEGHPRISVALVVAG